MTTKDKVSLHLAKLLHEKGYDKYSDEQYVELKTGELGHWLGHCKFPLEICAYVETTTDKKFIYVPTLDEAYEWILSKDPNWIVSVLWNNEVKGYYFVVQNTETGYEYRQPPTPEENDTFKMYEWGMEHVLNRLETNK